MRIQSPRRRKAISPILATVILIAITLIAAIAIAGFVFGLFGTFTTSQNMQIIGDACSAATKTCTIEVSNTGGSAGGITGCSIYGTAGKSGAEATYVETAIAAQATVTVPAGTTSAAPVYVGCTVTGTITQGAAVTGTYVVASGAPLAFSAISGA